MRIHLAFGLVFLPLLSFSQVGLKYFHINGNYGGVLNAPNFKDFISTYNSIGPKPFGSPDYHLKSRGTSSASILTGFGASGSRILFTVGYIGGGTSMSQMAYSQSSPLWQKTVRYDYNDFGIGCLFHVGRNKQSDNFPRFEFHIGLDKQFTNFIYADKTGTERNHRSDGYALNSFIQYNFGVSKAAEGHVRFIWGLNLRFHSSLQPIDFSALQRDLGITYTRTNEIFSDFSIGLSIGNLDYVDRKTPKPSRSPKLVATIPLDRINSRSPIGTFYFQQSLSQLKDENSSALDSIVNILQSNIHLNVLIVGHTSSEVSSDRNEKLSLDRAKVIKRLLVKRGVRKSRVSIDGRGAGQPKSYGGSEERQAQNRRAEVFLVN